MTIKKAVYLIENKELDAQTLDELNKYINDFLSRMKKRIRHDGFLTLEVWDKLLLNDYIYNFNRDCLNVQNQNI